MDALALSGNALDGIQQPSSPLKGMKRTAILVIPDVYIAPLVFATGK